MFEAAERLARQLGKSRSQLHAEAVAHYIGEHSDVAVTARLNAIYGADPALSKLDPVVQRYTLDQAHTERSEPARNP